MADHSVNAPCAVSHVPGPVLAYGYGGEQDRHSARPHMALPEQRGRDAGKRHIRAFWAPCCRKCWRCHRAGSLSHGAGVPRTAGDFHRQEWGGRCYRQRTTSPWRQKLCLEEVSSRSREELPEQRRDESYKQACRDPGIPG